jgi:hypothetical protein
MYVYTVVVISPNKNIYSGIILQDLTFIYAGNINYLSPQLCQGRTDMINFGKRWQQFAILDAVRKFKTW